MPSSAWGRSNERQRQPRSKRLRRHDRRIEEGGSHLFFSAGWQVLEERNLSGQTITSNAWSIVYVDAMVARDRDTDANGSLDERLYPMQDANSNVTAVTDSTGTTIERYLLDAYGQRIILDGTFTAVAGNISTVAFNYGHQGGKYDSVLTNQMLFRNRVYDVETTRWLQEDPAGTVDGTNLVQYVLSNVENRRDPSGLFGIGLGLTGSVSLALPVPVLGGVALGLGVSVTEQNHVGVSGWMPYCKDCLTASLSLYAGAGGMAVAGLSPTATLKFSGVPATGSSVSLGFVSAVTVPLPPGGVVARESLTYDIQGNSITAKVPGIGVGAAAFMGVTVSGNCTACAKVSTALLSLIATKQAQFASIFACIRRVIANITKAINALPGTFVAPGGTTVVTPVKEEIVENVAP